MEHGRKKPKCSKVIKQNEADKTDDWVGSCHQHPLLFPEVLDIIFKYMDGDYMGLRVCREVCMVWNKEVCKVLKNCNSPALIATTADLEAFYDDLKKPNSQIDIFKGIAFSGPKIQNNNEIDYIQSAGKPISPLLSNCLKKFVGQHITFLDISLIVLALQKNDSSGLLEPRRMKLSDLRKLIFVMCPNLTHLVLREVQKQFVQKSKSNGESQCQSKLKSLVLKNEIPDEWYASQLSKTSIVERNHDTWHEFYDELLLNCPDLEHVGYFFHLSTSSKTYLELLATHIDNGRLKKLKSIERVSHGRTGTRGSGAHIDMAATRDLVANFKSIQLRSNLVFIPAQLSYSFRSSWNTVEDLTLSANYYNEANYLTAVRQFDENRIPIPNMENLKKLCLRGGIPLEPFLLGAPNLEELVMSFMGSNNCENEKIPPIKFWNEIWCDVRLTPLYNLRKLDIGHCAFICPHDIQTIAILCPSIKTLAVPFQPNGCIQSVFISLPLIEELDIILFDDESILTDDILIGGSANPGITGLQKLQVLRVRVNEISKLIEGAHHKLLPINYVDIAECCMLTDEFISYISNGVLNLKALQFEAGQFTDFAWNSLSYDELPSLTYLEIPNTCMSSNNALHQLRTNLPWTRVSFSTYKPTKTSADINLSEWIA